MSAWLFDLGNSRLKCAPLRDGGVGDIVAIDHDGHAFAGDWERVLPPHCDSASIACVAAPGLVLQLLQVLVHRCSRISIARTQAAFDGVRIAYAQPQRLGVDRFLALLAARARCPEATLVVGVGTALTIDLLDADGRHRGGRIAPSPALMRAALHARAPQLPAAGGRWRQFADDTADALASGCEGAALGLVAGSLEAAASLLGVRPRLLLHGGGAGTLLSRLDGAVHAPALVLEGLARWAHAGR